MIVIGHQTEKHLWFGVYKHMSMSSPLVFPCCPQTPAYTSTCAVGVSLLRYLLEICTPVKLVVLT